MKSIGIVRRIDELGRIVIPKELFRTMDIKRGDKGQANGTSMEIFTDGKDIVLRRYNPGCHCCGELGSLTKVLDLDLCPTCLKEFKADIKVLEYEELKKLGGDKIE